MIPHTEDYLLPEYVQTLPGLFWERIRKSPDLVAYRSFDSLKEKWQELSWQGMGQQVSQWYEALKKEKLQPGDRVALMLPNGPNWISFDLAALSHGLVVVPLFANDRPDNIAYILEQTETQLLLCPGLAYWNDLEPVLDRLTHLRRIITLDFCKAQDQDARIICCENWLNNSTPQPSIPYPTDPDALATIVYTSGTTGPPKGVMLSHRNILENCHAGLQAVQVTPQDVFLSFLPLSHMLERTVGYYLPMMAGAQVAYARSIPELAEDLVTIQPTVLISVPRIFERIYSGIRTQLDNSSWFTRTLFHLAVASGWKHFCAQQQKTRFHPLMLLKPLIHPLVAPKVQKKLGGNLRAIISGGAPLSPEIAHLFLGLGLPLLQGYGLTETSPVVSVNRLEENDPASVGPPLPGVEVDIAPSGELLVRGSGVMLGYWQDDKATDQIIDATGWLHTGDKADLRKNHIYITGRLKEILVLSNSEKVPPADLEMAIMLDPLFEQAMIIGENKPYLSLLIVVQPEEWQKLCRTHDLPTASSSLSHPKILVEAQQRVEQQLKTFPGFMKIKTLCLLAEPWTVENGLLTPTLKIKRERVAKQYSHEIEGMYRPRVRGREKVT